MKLRVTFGTTTEVVEADAAAELSTEAALLSFLTPLLSESFQSAVAGARFPVILQVAVGSDQVMLFEEVIMQLSDDDRHLSSLAIEDDTAVFTFVETKPESVALQLVNSAGVPFGMVQVTENASAKDVLRALCADVNGDMTVAIIQYPGKRENTWMDLKVSPDRADQPLLAIIGSTISGMLPFIKPSVPSSMGSLRVKLPPDAARKAATNGLAGAPVQPPMQPPEPPKDGKNTMKKTPEEDWLRVLKAMEKPDRVRSKALMYGTDNVCLIRTLGDEKFVCSLCDSTAEAAPTAQPPKPRSLGEGMSGLIRHLLSVKEHIPRRHASMNDGAALSSADATAMMESAAPSKTFTNKRNAGGKADTAKKIRAIAKLAAKNPDAFSPAARAAEGCGDNSGTVPETPPTFGANMAAPFQ